MRHRFLIFVLLNIAITYGTKLFAGTGHKGEDTSMLHCKDQAAKQLDEALVLMQKHYYKKEFINWDSLVTAAKARLVACETCEDAFQTVNWCFGLLSEPHSYIMPTTKAAVYNNDTVTLKRKPHISQLVGEIKAELIPDKRIAYLTIPWISTTDSAICTRLADSIQNLIAGLDGSGINKWIIDLRKNTGGNCWPMLAGIGPLLGEGVCGYFVSGDDKVSISYSNGAAMQGRHIRCKTSGASYKTKNEKNYIIVLTGTKTASSGEIVALAFKGKKDVLQYGEPTAGFTTANSSYILSDKSMLVLTVSMEADRNGKIYDGGIRPDEIIMPDPNNPYDDTVKAAAMMWLDIL